jgi:hypothetical protein
MFHRPVLGCLSVLFLVAKVPPAFGNSKPQVTVSNPDGTSATLTNGFTYKSTTEVVAEAGAAQQDTR